MDLTNGAILNSSTQEISKRNCRILIHIVPFCEKVNSQSTSGNDLGKFLVIMVRRGYGFKKKDNGVQSNIVTIVRKYIQCNRVVHRTRNFPYMSFSHFAAC